MPMYRKKPVIIEAFQMTKEGRDNVESWPEFLKDAFGKDTNEEGAMWTRPDVVKGGQVVFIRTLEGPLTVSENDWVIRGVQDELYPCKPDIFAETYEPA